LRVLIVRIGAMGDVLHAMPAVAALRELHPDWFIGWAIEPSWSVLLQSSGDFARASARAGRSSRMPIVDQWYPVATKEWKKEPLSLATLADIKGLRGKLREEEFDLCVDMQGLIRSAVVGRLAGATRFVGRDAPRERAARWLYSERIAVTSEHVVEQGCELLGAAVGETLRPAKVALPLDEEAEAWADRMLEHAGLTGKPFAFLAATAGWGAKQWPAERYGAVAAALGRAGFRTLVNEALGDRISDKVIAASEGFATLVPCSIGEMISLMRRAAVVIAGDTGPLHLAAALERPVVAIFGPTDPVRTGPYGAVGRVLRSASSLTNHTRLREAEAGMLKIRVDEVVAAALEVLDGKLVPSAP
jgi:heptosyltransferase-1